MKKLRILQWNADGVNTKMGELEWYMKQKEIDVVAIQEMKLMKTSRNPKIAGFTCVRKDRMVVRTRAVSKGGGLAIFVKENIPMRRLKGWKGESTEGLSVAIDVSSKERLVIINIYRPPI